MSWVKFICHNFASVHAGPRALNGSSIVLFNIKSVVAVY